VTTHNQTTSRTAQLAWLENIASLMDRAIKIPGTKIRIGLDPIIGLIPVVGDLISFGISSILLYAAFMHGASRKVVMKMLMNIALDSSIGMIPVLGNIFDFAFKANSRNYILLSEHWQEGKHKGSGWQYIVIGLLILLVLMGAVMLLIWKLLLLILSL